MKTNQFKAFFAILTFIITITGQNCLFGMKKDKKRNDDFAFLEQQQQLMQQRLKEAEQKKTTELKQLALQNTETEKKLLIEYQLIQEFKTCHKGIDLWSKDTLKNYYTWLKDIKSFYEKQDDALKHFVAYAKHFAELDDVVNQFYQAWGSYVQLFPNGQYSIDYLIDKTHDIEEWILGLRYLSILQQGYQKFYLTPDDYVLLNESLKSNATAWFAKAVLTTDTYFKRERESASFCKSIAKKVAVYKKQIEALPLSETIKNTWFKQFFMMMSLMIKNHGETQNHTANEKQFYSNIQKIYDESLKQRGLILQSYDQELEKLKNKLEPKEKSKPIKGSPTPLKKPLQVMQAIPEYDELTTTELQEAPTLKITDTQTIIEKQKPLEQPKCIINLVTPSLSIPYAKVLDRVNIWYRDPSRALDNHEFKYGNKVSKEHYDNIIKCHTFSDMVDYFIEPLAIKCSWQAKNSRSGDISYNIPGQIIDHTTKEETIGVFSYGINKQGVLFHRCFSQRAYEKIENDVLKQTYDGLYPDLSDDKTIQQEQLKLRRVKTIEEGKGLIKQNNFYVEIEDKENNMTIRLFKVKKNKS